MEGNKCFYIQVTKEWIHKTWHLNGIYEGDKFIQEYNGCETSRIVAEGICRDWVNLNLKMHKAEMYASSPEGPWGVMRWRKATNAKEMGARPMFFDTTKGLDKLHYYWSGIEDVVGYTAEDVSSEDKSE